VPVGAQLPFGMVRVGPDTALDGYAIPFNHFGGYYYNDNEIRLFSHLHMVGSGVLDYGTKHITIRFGFC
jgi:putative alpha-1,2-mannosidase